MAKIGYFKAKIEDFDKFYDFFSNSTKDLFTNEYGSKTITYFLAHSDSKINIKKAFKQGFVLTAHDEDNLVGYIVIPEKPEGGVWFISWIVVKKEYWGQGIGTNMLKNITKEALKKGVHCLTLLTDKIHIGFYNKQDFTLLGCNPKGYYGVPDYYFYKIIQEPREENFLRD